MIDCTHKWQDLKWGCNSVWTSSSLQLNGIFVRIKRSNRNESNQSHETRWETNLTMVEVACCMHVCLSISTCVPPHKSYLSALLSNPKSSGLAACTERVCHHLKYTLTHTTNHSGRFLATRGVPEPQWNQAKNSASARKLIWWSAVQYWSQ